jgi:hypothetical protein
MALGQVRQQPIQQLLLPGVLLPLARRAVPARGAQLLQSFLHHRQIGEGELQVQLVDVAPWIRRTIRGRVVERARDMEQGVRVADQGEHVRLDGAFPRRASRDRDVHVRHVGRRRLLRVEQLGQPVQALIGDLHHADVRRRPAAGEAAGFRVAAGQRVEDGGLAGPR